MEHHNQINGESAEMPRYRSHKEVWALKITGISAASTEAGALLHVEAPYAPLRVSEAYLTKHTPKVGGYYVRYADGYESWSPAEAFEEGYTRVN